MDMPNQFVLANGRIVDGCGNPWYRGDLAINHGRISDIAPPGTLTAQRIIDVQGGYIVPGFIDIHTHSDLAILINRQAESVVRQGVTTELIGNCGMSPAPVEQEHLADIQSYWGSLAGVEGVSWKWRSFGSYLEAIEKSGIAINIGSLVGHGALRIASMGFAERPPSSTEFDKMISLLSEAMEAGAFGMSTGLVYPPGCFTSTQEIIALCQVVSKYGGIYTSHIRGERETILEAVAEAIEIGRRANIPVQISHNAPKFGAPCSAVTNLGMVEAARAEGLDITVDNDVHTDLAPSLIESLPQRIQHYSIAEIQGLLSDHASRDQIKEEIISDQRPAYGPAGLLKHGRWDRIIILQAPHSSLAVGNSIEKIAQETGIDPFDVYFDLIVANGPDAFAIFDYIDEENIQILLRHPLVMICSDGAISAPYGPLNDPPPYSPCSYGEFPGILERYVRDRPVLTLENATRKMTSFPAQRLGLFDRGILRPGAWADIVVLDLEHLHDRATNLYPHTFPFENFPHQYPQGIDYVFVNGCLVVEGDRHTGSLPGTVLKRSPVRRKQ